MLTLTTQVNDSAFTQPLGIPTLSQLIGTAFSQTYPPQYQAWLASNNLTDSAANELAFAQYMGQQYFITVCQAYVIRQEVAATQQSVQTATTTLFAQMPVTSTATES